MQKVLILGNRSFVAKGLTDLLTDRGMEVVAFGRGDVKQDGFTVTGPVFDLVDNPFLGEFDVVINFVLLKEGTLKENLQFVDSIVKFCKHRKVKHLVHFSSVMVYANNEREIDEHTPVEVSTEKSGYGEIKIAVDQYLDELRDMPFSLTFVRPGYVLAEDRLVPFIKQLPLFKIVKGDRKSVQPVVKREDIHNALLNMIQQGSFDRVFLFTPNQPFTKYQYAKEAGGIVVWMPRWLVLGVAKIMKKLNFISPALYVRVEGMYIRSVYNSVKTQTVLNVKF